MARVHMNIARSALPGWQWTSAPRGCTLQAYSLRGAWRDVHAACLHTLPRHGDVHAVCYAPTHAHGMVYAVSIYLTCYVVMLIPWYARSIQCMYYTLRVHST